MPRGEGDTDRRGSGPTPAAAVLPWGAAEWDVTLAGLVAVLLVGIAAGAASTTLAWAELFDPLRARLTGRAAYFAGCPVCLGGWLSLALTALQGAPEGLHSLVAWWAAWGVSSLVAAGLRPLTRGEDERRLEVAMADLRAVLAAGRGEEDE